MDPFIGGALITGGASLLGGLMSNQASAQSAAQQMQFQNAQTAQARRFTARQAALGRFHVTGENKAAMRFAGEQAQNQMDFQHMMSSSAHQREIRDLKKAGLNPILSGTGGMGAASAAGAAGHGSSGGSGIGSSSAPGGAKYEARDVLSPAVASALHVTRLAQEVKNMKAQEAVSDADLKVRLAQEENIKEDTTLKNRDIRVRDQDALLRRQQFHSESNRTRREYSDADRSYYDAEISGHSAKGARVEGEIDESRYGEVFRYIDRAIRAVIGGSSAARNVRGR